MTIRDLQLNLQSEIQDKERIRKELSSAKAFQVSLEKYAVDFLMPRQSTVFLSTVKLSVACLYIIIHQ